MIIETLGTDIAKNVFQLHGPPEPEAPACSCRAACPSPRSPATPARWPEPGSSALHDRKHPRQRRGIHRGVNRHPNAAGERDLDPPGRRRRVEVAVRRRRIARRRNNHRHKSTAPGPAIFLAKPTPPRGHYRCALRCVWA